MVFVTAICPLDGLFTMCGEIYNVKYGISLPHCVTKLENKQQNFLSFCFVLMSVTILAECMYMCIASFVVQCILSGIYK